MGHGAHQRTFTNFQRTAQSPSGQLLKKMQDQFFSVITHWGLQVKTLQRPIYPGLAQQHPHLLCDIQRYFGCA